MQYKKFRLPGRQIRAWLPLGAELALLGILGSGKHTDLTAHLFGFMAGLIPGAFYCVLVKQPAAGIYQICFFLNNHKRPCHILDERFWSRTDIRRILETDADRNNFYTDSVIS